MYSYNLSDFESDSCVHKLDVWNSSFREFLGYPKTANPHLIYKSMMQFKLDRYFIYNLDLHITIYDLFAPIMLLGHANILLDIATNDSFKDEKEGDTADIKADNNDTANAVEVKVINGHAQQEAIDQMMLPYLQLQITAKFEYI
ncbi:hypothetical protein MAM1_0218d08206 [Mucor ambiguus]|uniref:Uncharacterized protein n=1 Tax=Mucor ambiguus TaxID=91626 RepID=A0A0C9MDI0_9FUNG|nr:hypothetical protein MAM1_0218d08206 [Mucor ambiguus]